MKDIENNKLYKNNIDPQNLKSILSVFGLEDTVDLAEVISISAKIEKNHVKRFKNIILSAIIYYGFIDETLVQKYKENFKNHQNKFYQTDSMLSQIYLMLSTLEIKKTKNKQIVKKLYDEKYLQEHRTGAQKPHKVNKNIMIIISQGSYKKIKGKIANTIKRANQIAKWANFISHGMSNMHHTKIQEDVLEVLTENIIKPLFFSAAENFENQAGDILTKTIIKQATKLVTPGGIAAALIEIGNEVGGKAMAMTFFPNKIGFELRTDKNNVYFRSLIPSITYFQSGKVLPYKSEHKFMLDAFLDNNNFIVTNKNPKIAPYYRPYYQTHFSVNKHFLEKFLNKIDNEKFIDIFWKHKICKNEFIAKNYIDDEKCEIFNNNDLDNSYVGDALDNDSKWHDAKDDFINMYENHAYLDFIDLLADKICKDTKIFGWITCNKKKSSFNILNKTRGIFVDTLYKKYYNLKKSNNSVTDSPKIIQPIFKVGDLSRINLEIQNNENNIIFTNNSEFDIIFSILNTKSLNEYNALMSIPNIEKELKQKQSITISKEKIKNSLFKYSTDKENLVILTTDIIMKSYATYLGKETILDAIYNLKPKKLDFIDFIETLHNSVSIT